MIVMSLRHAASLLVLLALFAGLLGAAPAVVRAGGGTITLAGLHGPVVIVRDRAGVPSTRARSEDDAQFGLGYAHAQDRLWQMEWQRRLASGRSAELIGADGLPADTLFRTVGLRRAAEASWAALAPDEQRPLLAYVAGINAFLASREAQALPPEFAIVARPADLRRGEPRRAAPGRALDGPRP
jgi:penicillin amidase